MSHFVRNPEDRFSCIRGPGINPLRTGNPQTGTIANSEDPGEMPAKTAFHQGLNLLLRQNQSLEKEIQYFFLKLYPCNPSIYTMDHPDLSVCNLMENQIGLKKVK